MTTERSSRDATDDADPMRRFAVRVGNEIRNPLAAILSAHEYVRRRVEADAAVGGDPKVRHFFDIIETELGAVTKVVADLLDFGASRQVHRSSVLLRDICAGALREVRVPLHVTVDNATSDALDPALIDRQKTQRALVQLIQNACDAASAREKGHVVIRASREGAFVLVEVTDDGEGFEPAALDRLREPLVSTKAKGTGLGLAIADALIRAQSGEIVCEPREGGGSRFVIRLPAQ